MEESVDVWKEGVADSDRCFSGVDYRRPYYGVVSWLLETRCDNVTIWFLRISREGVVIPVEGEESAELHPPIAKLLVGIAIEAVASKLAQPGTRSDKHSLKLTRRYQPRT